MQIKITMRHQLIATSVVTIKKKKKQKIASAGEDVEKLNTCRPLVEIQNGIAAVENTTTVTKIFK